MDMHASSPRPSRLRRPSLWVSAGLVAALVGPIGAQTKSAKSAAPAHAPAASAAAVADTVDYDAMYKIREEATTHSALMQTFSYLTDVNGPRLTNSPGMWASARWAEKQLTEWGLSNVHLEKWGPFGRGWENQKFTLNMTAPMPFILQGYPKAWTAGTNGPVTADVVLATLNTPEDLEKVKGTLKGKIVLLTPAPIPAAFANPNGRRAPSPDNPSFEPLIRRYTESDLNDLQKETVRPFNFAGARGGFGA